MSAEAFRCARRAGKWNKRSEGNNVTLQETLSLQKVCCDVGDFALSDEEINDWFILSSAVFLLQRDSWEQSEPVSQVEALCQDNLASVSVPPSMPSPEPPGSPSQYRSPSRSSSLGPVSSSQPYTLHSLEDVHYHPLTSTSTYPTTPSSSSFPCPPYMSSPVTDLVTKMVTEEAADGHGSLTPGAEAHSSWAKEEGVSAWSPYEIRRAYWLNSEDSDDFTDTDELNTAVNSWGGFSKKISMSIC